MYYNRFRYYDKDTGQYISPDPIGLLSGFNPYGYVHCPTGWVNPFGLIPCPLPEIKGTQEGFKKPQQIDDIKKDMLNGNYDFTLDKGRISVIIDHRGVYHVSDGHHRMAAAQELYKETGNDFYIRELLKYTKTDRDYIVASSRSMPSRNWWGALRNKWEI